MTLTGKRPPNRDPFLQRTELVQDTKAVMVQDTQLVRLLILDNERGVDVTMIVIFITELFTLCWQIDVLLPTRAENVLL